MHRDFGIDLGRRDIRVTKNSTDTFDGYALVESEYRKTMSGAMQGDMFMESTLIHDAVDALGHRAIFHRWKDHLPFLMVAPDNFLGDR